MAASLATPAGKPVANEEWLTFADGGYQGLFETVKTPMWDAAGQLIGVLGIAWDITERKRTEEQLRIAATAFEAQEGILIAAADKTILRVNGAFSAVTGYGAEDAVGRTLELLQPDDGSTAFLDALWWRVDRDGAWQGEIGSRRRNGEVFPLWLNVSAESLVLDNLADTVDKMKALKQLGVGCSMDEFGTGYSSLSYLARLPIDQVKIDQSFVRNLPGSASDAAVAQTIIALARNLGLSVIAEGVETETQRQFLERHECSIYQGYLFSQPVPVEAFEQLVAATR